MALFSLPLGYLFLRLQPGYLSFVVPRRLWLRWRFFYGFYFYYMFYRWFLFSFKYMSLYLWAWSLLFGVYFLGIMIQQKTADSIVYFKSWKRNINLLLFSFFHFIFNVLRGTIYSVRDVFLLLFFVFCIILFFNFYGNLPFSFSVTSHIIFTFFFALSIFLSINFIGVAVYGWGFLQLFLPKGAPFAIVPFLLIIEIISYIARVFSLSIRLFANLLSGHILLHILSFFVWIIFFFGGFWLFFGLLGWSLIFVIVFLETGIAFLQAYVFVVLLSLYFKDIWAFH